MASNYPASLDTTATLPSAGGVGANLSTFPHSALTGNVNDAVIALETELGTAPSGTLSTVKARLDKIAPYTGVLTSYTPTVSQGVAVTVTNAYSWWIRIGRLILGGFNLAVTSTGTASNVIIVSAPVTAKSAGALAGDGTLNDESATPDNIWKGFLQIHSTATDFSFKSTHTSQEDDRFGVATFQAALTTNDVLRGLFQYEAAAD